jgi:hypothetical protein
MPIPLPDLDDRTFDDLTEEARALLPVLYRDWTDHNPSDPGIVLVELFAWLTEMLLFQVNQIPAANTRKFLALLGTPESTDDLGDAIRATMGELHERYRAVTPADYEYLVRETFAHSPEAAGFPRVQRVRCVPGRDLTAADATAPTPAHVSVVVLPEPGSAGDTHPRLPAELAAAVAEFLRPRRLLTTRHHVVGPSYVEVGIAANLALREDAPPLAALEDARRRLVEFFDPLDTPGRTGWPFGQNVYASEVYAVLEPSALIDYVEDVRVTGAPLIPGPNGPAIGVELDDHQLVRLGTVDLLGYDSYGRTHTLPRTDGS